MWALIPSSTQPNNRLAIFVHGFLGDYLTTWGPLASLLERNADADPDTRDWDFLFLGYPTKSVETYLDISMRIADEWRKASGGLSPYQRQYAELALFGHSLGTLGIRQYLCDTVQHTPNLISRIRGVTFFGSPLNGSPLARWASLVFKVGDALKPDNCQARMLKRWTQVTHSFQPWRPVNIIWGMTDQVVGTARPDLHSFTGDGPPSVNPLGHLAMKIPGGWNDTVISDIKNGLR